MSLVTVAQIKAEMKTEKDNADLNTHLLYLARYVTQRWKDIVGFDMEPSYRTRNISVNGNNLLAYGTQLRLPEPLLEPSTISSNGSALTYNSNVYAEPLDASPIGVLRLGTADGCYGSWYPSGALAYNTVAIAGWWGYRSNYSTEGWIDTQDKATAQITANATTFTVADADGADALYRTPRFSSGNLLRVDDELMEVVNVVYSTTNTVTVLRGVRGTTAAVHEATATICAWNPEPDVSHALAKAAGYKYASIGAFQEVEVKEMGAVTFPADMPKLVYAVAQRFVYGY